MSDNLPPAGDPDFETGAERPPQSKDFETGAERPPQSKEYLDSHAGDPIPEPTTSPRTRRTALIAGGALGAVAIAGAATWAAVSFFGSGPDAAEALPSSTLAFASVNLDPSGEQKIEALATLKKFPGLKDKLNFDTADDVRKHIFEEIQKEGGCVGVDYAADIEPWLGDRMAIAAVDAGETDPSPVFVVQVTDQDKAKAGLEKLAQCDTSTEESGYAFEDGWAVVAETQAIADNVVAQTKDGVLADDDTYKQAIDEAGDSGIVSMYAAPAAGERLVGYIEKGAAESPFGADLPTEMTDQFKNFKGAAGVVRFRDGSLEMEVAGDFSAMSYGLDLTSAGTADVVSTLPQDTAFAVGMSLPKGWLQTMVDTVAPMVAPGETGDQLLAEIEQQTGLDLPEDVETLTGKSLALAVSGDIDIEQMINSGDPSSLEIGVKVEGDAAAANLVLDKIRAQMGPQASLLTSKDSGDYFAVGPNAAYLDTLLGSGDLGSSPTFKDVVPHAEDASSVVYLDFDAGDNWLVKALEQAGAPSEVTENVEPLSAFGISAWMDGDVSHELIKLTTD